MADLKPRIPLSPESFFGLGTGREAAEHERLEHELTQLTEPAPGPNRPDPDWIRGRCPHCGDDLVSNAYYVGGKGYIIVWECWGSLQWPDPVCDYRRVL
jgi:hypothetical protein